MSAPTAPGTGAVLTTLVGVTWRRLFRGRALWVSVLIALLPAGLAAALAKQHATLEPIEVVQYLVMCLLPPMFVASSLGEEIEDRTTTYLWSRPIARWTIVVGKLIALAPIAMVLVVVGWFLAVQVKNGAPPPAISLVAFGAGALAIAAMSAGLATLVPRHGMALSIVYLVIFDLALGAIPASIQNISITRQVRLIGTNTDLVQAALTMVAIACGWLAVAMRRIRRLES
jgi:ABC-type transport system involved in multi-copper enzyme maturation permease subunit